MFLRQIPGFEEYMLKYIRMGLTIFKFVIWGGISLEIRSEIMFYGDTPNKISDRISDDIPPQMTNLNTVIPLIICKRHPNLHTKKKGNREPQRNYSLRTVSNKLLGT